MSKLFFLLIAMISVVLTGCNPGRNGAPLKKIEGEQSTVIAKPKVDATISIRAMDRRVPVIMFHDIISHRTSTSVWFDCTTAEFESQMAWIQRNGITPITVDALYAHLTQGKEIPKDSIVLSFDDNYLGFYQNAWPILKKYNFPSIMFVHTNYVGDLTGGHPKMNWQQLTELEKAGLVTVGAHTQSHPLDITKIPASEQEQEIQGCKPILERHLGHAIKYFAYPNGKNDAVSQDLAKKAGYLMAFTIDSGMAEQSPNLFAVHRYERNKLELAWQDRNRIVDNAPVALAETAWKSAPVSLKVGVYDGLKIAFASGGQATTVLSDTREAVGQLVSENHAAAGINGGFFAMAALSGTSNIMIGPCYPGDRKKFIAETSPALLEKLWNRPVLIWGPKGAAIAPFQPNVMNDEAEYRAFMPDFSDLFLAGAWIVHDGVALTNEQMLTFGTRDLADPRRRVFFGWNGDGQPVFGASLQTCSTERLAEAAAAAGVKEAVLLDSGFSTSLVFDGRIVVTGHTSKTLVSRPVPHAILLNGTLNTDGEAAMLASASEGAKSPSDIEGGRRRRLRRRTRRLRVPGETPTLDVGGQAPVPDSSPPPTSPPPPPPETTSPPGKTGP